MEIISHRRHSGPSQFIALGVNQSKKNGLCITDEHPQWDIIYTFGVTVENGKENNRAEKRRVKWKEHLVEEIIKRTQRI